MDIQSLQGFSHDDQERLVRADEIRIQAGGHQLDVSYFGNYGTQSEVDNAMNQAGLLRLSAFAIERQTRRGSPEGGSA